MSFVWDCAACCIGHWTSYIPLFPSCTQIWCWVKMSSTVTAHLGPALLCLCQRGWSSTPEVCQDCQRLLPLPCYSDGCNKSSLQLLCVQLRPLIVALLVPSNSKAVRSAPDQTATFPEKSLVRLLAVVVGVGDDVGVVGSRWLYICMFL